MAPHSHRSALLALVFVLALLALPAAAVAQSDGSARATERYYSSYGEPAATSSAAPSDDGPGWTLFLVGGAALLLVGVGFGAMGSRMAVRPHSA